MKPRFTSRFLSKFFLVLVLALVSVPAWADGPRTITFPSEDGLEVTADLYIAHKDKKTPFIVLFHQAGWSRGEYREIAPRLNALGFNCMAVDQRSGRGVNDVANQTAERAQAAKKPTGYVDALPDMRAALRYARKNLATGKVLAWGSSYSSSLVLYIAAENPELVDVALAFAPGEYFARFGKPKTWIRDRVKDLKQPVFITSAKDERDNWAPILAAIPGKHKTTYLPKTDGNHGSRALWKQFADSAGYWQAVTEFLQKHGK